MADVPEIIPLRWVFFRDNWARIRDDFETQVDAYSDPDKLRTQLEEFTDFIETQRVAGNANSNPFSSDTVFKRFYAVWDNIPLSVTPVSREELSIIQTKNDTVTGLIKTDFLEMRSSFVAARDEIADVTGHNDPDYDNSFNRSPVISLRDIRVADTVDMSTLHVGINATDFILANIGQLDTITVDPFALAKVNANNPNLQIDSHRSANMVRMRFNETLQSLANRFLGDSDRWQEIAIANGLRSPYVDETGSSIALIANGSENRINVAGTRVDGSITKNSLYVGQAVFLESTTLAIREQRLINNIKEVPVSGELVIELSGSKDLDKMQIIDSAAIRVFKPNTINSNFFVAIPSTDAPPDKVGNETPFFLAAAAEDEKLAGVDLSLDEDNDLFFTSFGDLRLSYGLENAIQAVQLKIANERGQLPRHPNFGLISLYGKKASDPTAIKAALTQSVSEMIEADKRFDRIETINVVQTTKTSGFLIQMVVRMAGAGSLVPISFSVNTG